MAQMCQEFLQSDTVSWFQGRSAPDWDLQAEMFVSVPVQTSWSTSHMTAKTGCAQQGLILLRDANSANLVSAALKHFQTHP